MGQGIERGRKKEFRRYYEGNEGNKEDFREISIIRPKNLDFQVN